MSEYIEIESEMSDDGEEMYLYTNLSLADGRETYPSRAELEIGSPVAQALAHIDGIAQLIIEESDLTITREPDAAWHIIVADVSAALKDFFL